MTIAITLALAVGSVLLVVCGFAWAARREEVALVRRIERLEVRPLADAVPGELVAVRGRAGASGAFEDPVRAEPALWVDARLVARDRGEELWSLTRGETLRLDDGSGREAIVELVGAEISIAPRDVDEADRAPSERMRALLAGSERAVPDARPGARYAIEHRAIRPGDALGLVGVPSREGDALRFTSADPLHLGPEPLDALVARLRADLRAMDAMLKFGGALGILLLAGGIALVLAS